MQVDERHAAHEGGDCFDNPLLAGRGGSLPQSSLLHRLDIASERCAQAVGFAGRHELNFLAKISPSPRAVGSKDSLERSVVRNGCQGPDATG
jgi:hypothetical protein